MHVVVGALYNTRDRHASTVYEHASTLCQAAPRAHVVTSSSNFPPADESVAVDDCQARLSRLNTKYHSAVVLRRLSVSDVCRTTHQAADKLTATVPCTHVSNKL